MPHYYWKSMLYEPVASYLWRCFCLFHIHIFCCNAMATIWKIYFKSILCHEHVLFKIKPHFLGIIVQLVYSSILFFFWIRGNPIPRKALFCGPRWVSKIPAVLGSHKRCTSWLETCYADFKPFATTLCPLGTFILQFWCLHGATLCLYSSSTIGSLSIGHGYLTWNSQNIFEVLHQPVVSLSV